MNYFVLPALSIQILHAGGIEHVIAEVLHIAVREADAAGPVAGSDLSRVT